MCFVAGCLPDTDFIRRVVNTWESICRILSEWAVCVCVQEGELPQPTVSV